MNEGPLPVCVGMDLGKSVNVDQIDQYETNTWVTQQDVFRLVPSA